MYETYEMYEYEDEQTELLCRAAKRTFEVFAWLKAKVPKSVKDVLAQLRREKGDRFWCGKTRSNPLLARGIRKNHLPSDRDV